VFDKPDKDAVVRSLSAVVGKAEEIAGEKRLGVPGDPRNSRTLLFVAKAVDEVHAELLGKAMDRLASYVGQVDASPKEMTAWARPELEKMTAHVLGQIQSPVFPDHASAHQKQYKANFQERLDHALSEFELGRANGRAIEATPNGPRRSHEAPSARPDYVNEARLNALRAAKSSAFDLSKLIRLCEELNSNWSAGNYYSVAMLVRAITDHVPPIFGARSFKEVAAQGSQSLKGQMEYLENSSRRVADRFLHEHVRRNEVLPTDTQVYFFAPALDMLLGEVAVELAEKARAEALAAAEEAAKAYIATERPVVTVGGDYKKNADGSVFEQNGKRFFRLEVGNYGKTAATLTCYDVRFASLTKVQTTQNDVSRRWNFNDPIAPGTRHRMIRDDIEIDPPDAEVVYGAYWYKSPFHEDERVSCFALMLRASDTWSEVPGVDESYILRT
jgi:hypothetical protein